jgi:hypothetical protein
MIRPKEGNNFITSQKSYETSYYIVKKNVDIFQGFIVILTRFYILRMLIFNFMNVKILIDMKR